jgi:hypothetical protein
MLQLMNKLPSKTINQKTSLAGWPKAREVIEITGHHDLEAADRALLNVLYQHAHDSGRMTDTRADWTVPLGDLRFSKQHKGSERVRASLERLLRIVVTVPYVDPHTGEDRFLLTHLFDFFDVSAEETARATLRFGLPRELQPILERSGKWGRIRAEIVNALTSKYAIAVYELVQARAHLNMCVETIPLEQFRAMVGVPPGKLLRGPDFQRRVLEPAVLEVNGLSDMGVTLTVVRKTPNSQLSPITSVTMAWWRKEGDDFREAVKERHQPKAGRMARLKQRQEEADGTA